MDRIFNYFKSVELLYTRKCNLKCAHCISDCSIEQDSKLDCNKVLKFLQKLPKKKIAQIGITGGEPLLYFDEIIKVISTAKKIGTKPKLISNGSWGSTKQKAEQVVSKLSSAGLSGLSISNDEFHLKFVPINYIFNIFEASRKYKLDLTLRISLSKNYSVMDFVANNKDYLAKLKSNEKPFNVFSQPLVPIGRASEYVSEENFSASKNFCKGRCRFLVDPAINHDGKLFVCCNSTTPSNDTFELGDLNSDSPEKLIDAYHKSLLVFYLRRKGPYFLVNLAEKHKLKKVRKTEKKLEGKYVGVCDYCSLNLGQYSGKDLRELLEEEFSRDKNLQEFAREEAVLTRKFVGNKKNDKKIEKKVNRLVKKFLGKNAV